MGDKKYGKNSLKYLRGEKDIKELKQRSIQKNPYLKDDIDEKFIKVID